MMSSIPRSVLRLIAFGLIWGLGWQTALSQEDLATAPDRIFALVQNHHVDEAVALGNRLVVLADRNLSAEDGLRVRIIVALSTAQMANQAPAASVALLEREIKDYEAKGYKGAGLATLYQALANPYGGLGRNLDAQQSATYAVELFQSVVLPNDLTLAHAYYTLSVQQLVLQNFSDELHSLRQILRICKNNESQESIELQRIALLGIADMYDKVGDTAKGADFRQQALALHPELPSLFSTDDYSAAFEKALAARTRGDLPLALQMFRQASELAQSKYGEGSPLARVSSDWLGVTYAELHDGPHAKPYMAALLNSIYDDYDKAFALMTEQEKLQFTTTAEFRLSVFCSYVNEFHDQDPSLIGKMYDLAIWSKGAVFLDSKSIEERLQANTSPKLTQLRNQLDSLRTQYRTNADAVPVVRNQLQNQMNIVEKQIIGELGVPSVRRFTWSNVKEKLAEHEAAVEFIRFHGNQTPLTTYYAALVLRPEWSAPKYILLGDGAEIEGKEFRAYALYATARLHHDPPILGFWRKIEDVMGGDVGTIYLSPDGIFNNIAFDVIPDTGLRLLSDKYNLRYLTGTRSLKRDATAYGENSRAVLVGDPAFDLPATAISSSEMFPNTTASNNGSVNRGSWKQLPGTSDEIESIAQIMREKKWQVDVLIRDRATKRSVLQESTQPRVLHFATHGYFPSGLESLGPLVIARTDKAMMESGLVLAGANDEGHGKEGLLSAFEVGLLNLSGTELVVLSACDTGLGDTQAGGEVFGLRRAFQLAGARAVLMTMWNVPVDQTTELMKAFYVNWLGGMEIHESLRRAQATVRSRSEQPFYWGAFVLVE